MERRQYSGNAPATSLSATIDSTTLTIPVVAGAGYPSGATGPFFICIDRGLASEEKIKCVATVSNTITASDRGVDGTGQASHTLGAAVEHVLTADDIDLFNQHAADVVDDHAQYARADGTRFPTTAHDLTGRHQFGAALGTPPAPANVSITASNPGSGATPARSDHVHLLTNAVINLSNVTPATAHATAIDLQSLTIPANTLNVGSFIHIYNTGSFTNTTAGTGSVNYQIIVGGSWTSIGTSLDASNNVREFMVWNTAIVTAIGSSGSITIVPGNFTNFYFDTPTGASGFSPGGDPFSVTVNTTGSIIIKSNGQALGTGADVTSTTLNAVIFP